ncbi:hypothetical protein J1605_015140 [Eschrichtius robustus]|uniref:L-fucose mutarotase n=1 Tax=Eschrichtius robustus TaxID=9764 RepID=A0AB34GE29_ESCRO|nr:hypothetical protein J1605_015140 [Eschrichtius robustus]
MANRAGCSVLADMNFPTASICRCGPEEIRADCEPHLLQAGEVISRAFWVQEVAQVPLLVDECLRVTTNNPCGLGIPQRLGAVLQLLPLDSYAEGPAVAMELVPSDMERGLQTPVWTSYQPILSRAGCASPLATIERFEFYKRTRKAFAVVTTREAALYGNLILKKGVLAPDALFQAC